MLIINNYYIVMVQYKMQILLVCNQIILGNKLMKIKERKKYNKLVRINSNKCHNNLFLHKLQLLNNFRGIKINRIKDFIRINIYLLCRINFKRINFLINKMVSLNLFKTNKTIILIGYQTIPPKMKTVNQTLILVTSKKTQMNLTDSL